MKESRKLHLQLSPIKEEWQSNLTQFKLPVLRIDNNREETRLHACSAATKYLISKKGSKLTVLFHDLVSIFLSPLHPPHLFTMLNHASHYHSPLFNARHNSITLSYSVKSRILFLLFPLPGQFSSKYPNFSPYLLESLPISQSSSSTIYLPVPFLLLSLVLI